MDYGFSISVKDLTSAQLKKIEQSIKSTSDTVKTETSNMENNFGSLGESIKKVGSILVEAFSVYELYNFGKELLNITAEFQTFTNVIKYSSEGIVDNAENIDFLTNAIDRLHLPMKETFQMFSEMQAGFVGTGIEGEKLRKVFEGMAEASTVMHLNSDQFSRANYALKEIGELGTLQSRQLRMLAIALPGAMSIAAKAMGMSTSQLHEAMKKGSIHAADFIPKFAEGLHERFAPGIPNANESLMAAMNTEKNEMIKMMVDMGNQLTPLFKDILSTVGEAFRDIKSVFDSLNTNNGLVNFLKTLFDWAVKLIPIWLAYKGVMYLVTLATDNLIIPIRDLAGALETEAGATVTASAAMESFIGILETSVIGAAVITLGMMVEKMMDINKQVDNLIDSQYKLSASRGFFASQDQIAAKVQEQYAAAMAGGKPDKDALQSISDQIEQNKKIVRDSLPVMKLRDSVLQEYAKVQHPLSKRERFFHGSGFPALFSDDPGKKIIDSANTSSARLATHKELIDSLGKIQQTIQKNFKIKPSHVLKPGDGGASKANAINTSNLSGASMGEAKTVIMHIGVVQQNNGVKESKEHAVEAAEYILRVLNNANSQNAQ